jgi:hypothetical protein
VIDLFAFNDRSRDWSGEVKALYDGLEAATRVRREKRLAAQMQDTSPSRALSAYAGTYKDPYYGEVEVVFREGQLQLSVGKNNNAVLKHWHYDTFLAQWEEDWRWESLVSFDLSPEGKVSGIAFDGRTLKRN